MSQAPMEIALKPITLWGRMLWLVPAALITLIGGLYVGQQMLAHPTRDTIGVTATWLCFGVIAAIGAADTYRVARLRGAALRLDAHGLLDRRAMRRPMPWSAITKIEVQTLEGQPAILGFWGEGARATRRRLPLWNYFGIVYVLELMATPFRFAPVSVDLQSLKTPPDQVVSAAQARWGGVISRREMGPVRVRSGAETGT